MTRLARAFSLAIFAATLSCDVPPEEEARTLESALPPCVSRFHFRAGGFHARLLDPVESPDPPPSTLRSAAAGTCRLVLREPTLAR